MPIDPLRIESALRRVKDERSFVRELLVGALDWPIDDRAEDLDSFSYEWTIDELRAKEIEKRTGKGTIRQIQPIAGNPWGVFVLDFEEPDVFVTGRGMTGILRRVLRGLVPSQRKSSHLPSFQRENLLFICNHAYRHYRFAYFKAPPKDTQTAPLAAFGWGDEGPSRTLCEFNLPALVWPDTDTNSTGWITAWAQAFDVEKVTQRFYRDYAAVFAEVERQIGQESRLQYEDLRMFTQTLFNRLMFLRFIERKGWLRFNGRTEYLRALYSAPALADLSFYRGRLLPLFFEGLAVEGRQESDAYGRVPFLNGGLFDRTPLDSQVLDLSNKVFAGILGDLTSEGLFYRYNFTVEESTPLDIEVAVDPEMLGKVFEELVTGRHETGSYYTPRSVVSFMCREALKAYLGNKTKAPAETIATLVDRQEVVKLKETHAREVLAALDDLKAVDPACGSGAYLLGLMQELIATYRPLYSDKLVKDSRSLYDLKQRIISQNLYGVDIDPFATNVAKLRLWLSLAVEADEPLPLPNLDFKIETGDSLLAPDPQELSDLFRARLQWAADNLAMVKSQFFLSHGEDKESYRETIISQESELREKLSAEHGEGVVDWRIQFAEAFANKRGGFDIVLANPPYVRQELITHLKPALKKIFPEVYAGGADLFIYFYARAVQLLRPGGVLSFIAPNKFFRSAYGEKLREYLAANTRPRVLIDFGDYPIFEAITYPAIIVTQKRAPAETMNGETVLAYNWQQSDDLTQIAATFAANGSPLLQSSLRPDGWLILEHRVASVLEKLRLRGKPLGELVQDRFFYGIKTGFNEAFEVDEETRQDLIKKDARSAEIIRPWLRGRNIQRWAVKWANKYLIYTPWSLDIDNYPAVKDHLSKYKARLAARPECRQGRYKWWCLARYASDYIDEFSQPKIVYQVIATNQQFAFTREYFLTNDKTWIIPEPPKGLLGVLNSKLVWFFLDQIAAKLQGGAYELRSSFMGEVPVAEPTSDLLKKILAIELLVSKGEGASQAAMTLERDIDDIVVRMYGLSPDDEHVIDDALAVFANRFPRGFQESNEYKEYVREMFGEE
jgi:hypothetical protein